MTLNEYQQRAMTTCMESSKNDIYAINGLTAEVGEINDKIAKWIRKGWISIDNNCITFHKADNGEFDPILAMCKEVGDVLWFVSLLSARIGLSLEDIAMMNLNKLASRQERGVIDGNGDNR